MTEDLPLYDALVPLLPCLRDNLHSREDQENRKVLERVLERHRQLHGKHLPGCLYVDLEEKDADENGRRYGDGPRPFLVFSINGEQSTMNDGQWATMRNSIEKLLDDHRAGKQRIGG